MGPPGPLFLLGAAELQWNFALHGANTDNMNEVRFWVESGLAQNVAQLAEPVLEDMGYRLVRVRITGENGCTVQIMAERPDGTLAIEDCTEISRTLSPLFDIEEPVPGQYHLEVSSPGVDRPLVRASDFERFAGQHVKIEVKELISGRRRFRGIIEGVENGEALIRSELPEFDEPQTIGLSLMNIAEAHIVFEPRPKGRKKTMRGK